MIDDTLILYERFHEKTGDPVAASNLTLAHALLSQQERAQERALTVSEAARRLKVGKKKVYALCDSGVLDHHRVGKSIRIPPEAVGRFIRQSSEEHPRLRHRLHPDRHGLPD